MECVFCKTIFESEVEEQVMNLQNKKKILLAEIEKFEKTNREKEAKASKKGLEKINRKIDEFAPNELCPRCQIIIEKIIEAKIEEKMEDIAYNIKEDIKDSISIEFND